MSFNSNTTHVVFKDGLLSTYKRAQSWNIPIVSILWIEACKVQRRLCDPTQFPISNIHMYEYPELYGKVSVSTSIVPIYIYITVQHKSETRSDLNHFFHRCK